MYRNINIIDTRYVKCVQIHDNNLDFIIFVWDYRVLS